LISMKERIAKKLGRLASAILKYVELSGEILVRELLTTDRKGLGWTTRKLRSMPDVQAIYNDLKQAESNSLRTVIWRLKQKGLLQQKSGQLSITELGREIIETSKNQKKWDGKWRMVFFDIPENRRKQRDWLRGQLKKQEFRMVQQSVFLGKNPLDQKTFERMNELGLGVCLRMITVGEIDDETLLGI